MMTSHGWINLNLRPAGYMWTMLVINGLTPQGEAIVKGVLFKSSLF